MASSYPFTTGVGYPMPSMPQYTVPINPVMPQPQIPRTEIPRVSGEDSIRSFQMGPDSSIIFVSNDPNSDRGWIVTTDSAAYKTIVPCRIIPYVEEQPLKASDLDEKFAQIDAHFHDIEERIKFNEQHAVKPSGNGKTDK